MGSAFPEEGGSDISASKVITINWTFSIEGVC